MSQVSETSGIWKYSLYLLLIGVLKSANLIYSKKNRVWEMALGGVGG